MGEQSPLSVDPVEAAAIEVWRQTKNDSADWDWEQVIPVRKAAYRRMALAVLTAAGCLNGLTSAAALKETP